MILPKWARLDENLPFIPWPKWSVKAWQSLFWVLIYSQTTAVRYWFAFASIGFACFICHSNTINNDAPEHLLMLSVARYEMWVVAFTIHGLALLYGVLTRTFNKKLLLLEGVLGIALWAVAAASVIFATGSFGGPVAGAMVQFWILTRYPTHWEYHNAD